MSDAGDPDADLLSEQIRYYEARAPIYEQLYFRQGAYAIDDDAWTRNWARETGELEAFVTSLPTEGSVLELACGNGLWTRFLAPPAARLVAVDSSSTMLARNRAWIDDDRVEYVEADLFEWEHDERFDLIFGGFFLSHIPPDRWASFWMKVGGWLAPGATLAFVDDCWAPDRPRSGDRVAGGPGHAHIRRLEDRSFTIVKRFFRPDELEAAFATIGFRADVHSTGEHFLYGTASV
ncbi:MAG TPA: class I SAM-dependent methyltransferase [Actinomycetota bacterium]|jgi:demethylmenaquinone methyltransferase/2-methoxy-6-polyprenyl-1,4-benzoquinol methylase|nr:class I SAM-dependent methyltransferase [Actinomycetota bacterium]